MSRSAVTSRLAIRVPPSIHSLLGTGDSEMMPAFQSLTATKRKSENQDESSRKRPAFSSGPSEACTPPVVVSMEEYWMVLWRNPQYKKHKTWDGDAVLVVSGGSAALYDTEGKTIATGKADWPLHEGKTFCVSTKEVELERPITRSEYISGQCFGGVASTPSIPASVPSSTTGLSKKFVPPSLHSSIQPMRITTSTPESKKKEKSRPVYVTSAVDNSPPMRQGLDIQVEDSHWTVNWRKQQSKIHKTWDGDAYLSHTGDKLTMVSEEGKFMGSAKWKGEPLHSGYHIHIGNKEIELDSRVDPSQLPTVTGTSPETGGGGSAADSSLKLSKPGSMGALIATKFITPMSFYGVPPKSKPQGPLYDPGAEDAVVMKAPTKDHMRRFNKKNLPVVPVVLDPILSRRMRPHQKEGVKFLYESVMGLRKHEGQGCILADEMGLGKTFQTISLVWTLLKQNPYAGAGPAIHKVLIVCPVSLASNWKAEFHKWLGRDRVGTVICDKDKKVVETFMHAKTQQVLIIGYERLRTVIDRLSSAIPPIGLIICDEGHRLKSANNKTSKMFKALRTPRRIILSGTPIQNDLGEFHAMADFCNPGLLDEYSTFRRVYEVPILKSRAPDASVKDTEVGEARTEQLLAIARSFVLRRDATLLKNYLPPKHEYVVFITPTALQLSIFSRILHPDRLDDLAQSSTAESLALINVLTKISNSPILLKATADKAKAKAGAGSGTLQKTGVDDALTLLPERAQVEDMSLSGKLLALASLLQVIRQSTEEKCVLVSHYTSTLNILEAYCQKKKYSYYRLDGQTPAAKRQEFVNSFNKSSRNSSFIFLLSSKAGGVGINLIGASRLCLIDSDWNPSHDLQSMARCHRDGQTRPVYIYRFLTAGAIDEKIYQRQVTKLGLSSSLMGSGSASSKSDSFSRKDLQDIFRVHPDTPCNTHDLLECPCEGMSIAKPDDAFLGDNKSGDDKPEQNFVAASQVKPEHIERAYLQKKKAGLAALGEWKHINCLRRASRDDIQDDVLRKLVHVHEPEGKANPPSPLSATEFENVAAIDEVLSVHEVPGGTVSFLFEKSSTAELEVTSDEIVEE